MKTEIESVGIQSDTDQDELLANEVLGFDGADGAFEERVNFEASGGGSRGANC
ncbi:hypothetical protein [Burkholderia sp. Bp9099]|uniref:hypothetical protein n=1 Tax=Burkholderia sp. Bp9099 TaxID=2184568 RepID=UPI001639D8B8|nr:hypothetical protein [Burkholderia sp. Bp9099]